MSDPTSIKPVLVVIDDAPALWRLNENSDAVDGVPTIAGTLALAIFSDAEKAQHYGQTQCGDQPFRIERPDTQVTVRVLAACVQQGVEVAVLDPAGDSARRAFDLKAILRRVREQLRAGEPLQF